MAATRYTQDLASPLSQVLQTTHGSATTNYLYGMDRLAAVAGSAKTWYGYDALGSVRQTLSNTGAPLGVVNYDPWGTVESGTVTRFGFTGELQSGGLVNLRARWYSTAQARFGSRDPFAGVAETPYSLHPYAYGYSDPVRYGDPSGRFCWDLGSTGYDFGTTCDHDSIANDISAAVVDIVPRYSAGFVQHGIDTLTGIAALANPETYRAAWRGVDALHNHPQQSWCFLKGAFLNGYTLAYRGTNFLADDPGGAANSLSAEEWGGITFDAWSTYLGVKGVQGAASLRAAREAEAAQVRTAAQAANVAKVPGVSLQELIAKSQPGNSSRVRIVTGSMQDAENTFRGIADPASIGSHPNPGLAAAGGLEGTVPGGGRIYYRPFSTSGPPTIDIHEVPGYSQRMEIKFIP